MHADCTTHNFNSQHWSQQQCGSSSSNGSRMAVATAAVAAAAVAPTRDQDDAVQGHGDEGVEGVLQGGGAGCGRGDQRQGSGLRVAAHVHASHMPIGSHMIGPAHKWRDNTSSRTAAGTACMHAWVSTVTIPFANDARAARVWSPAHGPMAAMFRAHGPWAHMAHGHRLVHPLSCCIQLILQPFAFLQIASCGSFACVWH